MKGKPRVETPAEKIASLLDMLQEIREDPKGKEAVSNPADITCIADLLNSMVEVREHVSISGLKLAENRLSEILERRIKRFSKGL